MVPITLVCEACGDTLATVDNSRAQPLLQLAKGLAPRDTGLTTCPGCGHGTKINFNILQKLIQTASVTH